MNVEVITKVVTPEVVIPAVTEKRVSIEVSMDDALYITAAVGALAPSVVGGGRGVYDALINGVGAGPSWINSPERNRLRELSDGIQRWNARGHA